MLKVTNLLQKSTIFIGLTGILLLLNPCRSLAQSAINPLEKEWINLNCDGEPSLSLAPKTREMIKAALADNKQLQTLFSEVGGQELTASLLDGFLGIASYSLGEFRRQSEDQSIGLLNVFFNQQTLDTVFKEVRSQLKQEMQQACLNQSTNQEYIWKKPEP